MTGKVSVDVIRRPARSSNPRNAVQTEGSSEGESVRIIIPPISSAPIPAEQRREWVSATSGSDRARAAMPAAEINRESVTSIRSRENMRASSVPQRKITQGTSTASR